MEKIPLFQIDRIIVVYVTQGILVIFFSLLVYQILRRKRQRINLIFSGYFLSMISAFILNMIYAVISLDYGGLIVFLHFLSMFFVCFGLIFILIVNLIILESTIIFSVKRQNTYIFLYGIILFFGMLILIIVPDPLEIIGVELTPDGRPGWKPIFFIYVITIITGFAIIPVILTLFKIYFSFETKSLKKKWFYYLTGSLGLIVIVFYPILILNLLTGIMPSNSFLDTLRTIVSISGISVIVWVLMMYYGIGSKLKK